jgi:hypothetical protein
MNTDLKAFIASYLRVVLMALLPLALTAFLSIPYTLGGHPGESIAKGSTTDQHMT